MIILFPEPSARSAVPGASPGRGLVILLSRKRSQKSINNRGRMGVMGGHLTDLKNTANNRSVKFLIVVEVKCLILKSSKKHD